MKNKWNSGKRLLALALCICMVLSLIPAITPLEVEAATTPTYISGIAVSYGTTANSAKNVLTGNGYTVINYDLNENAGGRYIYMGYKTTTDPSQAITGIFFSSTGSDSHPNSKTFDGVTAYLLGGSTEANPGENTYVDLNKGAGGNYIYTYVTRDTSRAPIIAGMYFNTSSSASGYVTPNVNLNDDAGGDSIYLHYQQFSGNASSTFYYLTSGGSRTSYTTSVSVKNHTQSVSTTPSVPSTVTYDGRTFTFRGWREDNTASSSTVSPSYTYMNAKTYRAVYSATLTLSYNANGGSGAPSSQTATQYINAGSSSVSKTSHSFTIPKTVPTYDSSKCIFLGWSTSRTATTAGPQPGHTITVSSNTTLYAVWQSEHPDKSYVNNGANHTYLCAICGKSVTEGHSYDTATQLCVCGAMNTEAVATLSKNGEVVAAYLSLNEAIQAVENCTADDEAVVTLLQNIALGNSYQRINGGIFTIDLNGKTLSNTNSTWATLTVFYAELTITDSGSGGAIYSENRWAIETCDSAVLTVNRGDIYGKRDGIHATAGSIVTVNGGTISGDSYGVYADMSSTVIIAGGSVSSGYYGATASVNGKLKITGGTITGDVGGVYTTSSKTVSIRGGTISGEEVGIGLGSGSAVEITGGSISCGQYDIKALGNAMVNLISATFPGGIAVYNTTLNAILGEDAAYWQGNTMIIPADDAYFILGGDVTVKDACQHLGDKTYTNNGADHSYTCSGCNNTFTEAHSYTNGLCACGAVSPDAVASVSKNGVVTGAYTTLNDAVQAVAGCTAADQAVLKLLTDINLGGNVSGNPQTIYSGVFTIDLNGKTLSNTADYDSPLNLDGSGVDVTITDSATGGAISTQRADAVSANNCTVTINGGTISSVAMNNGTLTINGGTISCSGFAVDASGSTVTITGGSFSGNYAIWATKESTLTISGGTISGNTAGVFSSNTSLTISGGNISGDDGVDIRSGSTVTISGGTISGDSSGVYSEKSSITISGGTISGGYNGVCASSSSTLTISDGTVSSGSRGVRVSMSSTATISGGSISGDACDISNGNSTITLIMDKNGIGATFPGGITVDNITLNAILGEGVAYWQGNTMILPADDATSITGGDVTIKEVCPHTASKTGYVDLKDGTSHSYICSGCNNTFTEAHSYDATTLLCVCGATRSDAVATVSKNGIATGAYTTLNDAIQAVKDCTADDKAVVTILQNIALGDSHQRIDSGVFTIDLNGYEISNTNTDYGALYLSGAGVNVTIQGAGENSKITGTVTGVKVQSSATLTVISGTISGGDYGVNASYSTVTINGGTISSDYCGVYAYAKSTVTISGGTVSAYYGVDADFSNVTISGGTIIGIATGVYADCVDVKISGGTISSKNYGLWAYRSTVTISGGSISGDFYDIDNTNGSTITLILGEDGVGARFPGGIEVDGTTLNAILGEGVAYWQGNTMILPADDATEITGGDVVIKAECKHPGDKTYTNNGDDHSYTYSCCNNTVTEAHSYDATTLLCVCGAARSDAVATVSKNGIATGAYTTLNDSIQAVENCTADDEAVITILQNIALGDSRQRIDSGVFTIDLNGFEISGTNSYWGVFAINGAATNVTIQGTGENSRITGDYICIEMDDNATLIITGGTISGGTTGVHAVSSSTVTVSGGSISGDIYGVLSENSTVTVTDGTISGGIIGGGPNDGNLGVYAMDSTVTISGGTISGTVTGMEAVGCTVTISGGAIKARDFALYARSCGTVTISGGSISGDGCDIFGEQSTITLTLGEDGVGATFPGGICVYGTTLNAILGEGLAYWQVDAMILLAENTERITDGDVTIKAECKHTNVSFTYTNNGADHSYTYSCCNARVTEPHSYTNGVCVCGSEPAVSVTIDGNATYYPTLNDAIQAVKNCTADDKAVVTILQDIALGNSGQKINSGVFTIDLNGYEISCENAYTGAVVLNGDVNVTIQGAGENSKIIGADAGVELRSKATLTIISGTISGGNFGVNASYSTVTISGGFISGKYGLKSNRGTVTISGGIISGESSGVEVATGTATISGGTISGGMFGIVVDRSTVTINGGTINANTYGVYVIDSTVTISGGSISCDILDIHVLSNSIIALTLGENGMGATFPGGITLYGTTLNAILGEGAAYWQNGKQLTVADDADEITGGDVVIKAGCAHSWLDATCVAPKTCSKCGATEGESTGLHIDENDNGRCDTCNCLLQPAKLVMATMSLEGNIGINYYMLLSDDVINDPTAFMQFTLVDGEVINVPVSAGIPTQVGDEILYLFTCTVNAKEMSDDVLAQCFYEGGSTQVYTYSVKAYCDHILNNSGDEALKDLVKKMLHYGAASQNYFQYNTDDLANAGLEAPNYEGIVIDGFKATAGQGTELSKLYAASLILKSETTLRFFFNGPITATYNGQALDVGQRSGLYYVDVTGIAAADLDEDIVITINDGTNTADIVFNPMSYCQGVFNNSDDAQLVELVTALYVYNQAANNYFEEM